MTTLDELIEAGLVQQDVSIAPMTTYKIGGRARFFAEATRPADLDAVAAAYQSSGLPLLVLGRGSNVVVSDRGYPGLVVRLSGEFTKARLLAGGEISAGGGMSLPALARFAVRQDRGGLEFLVAIPGSVGGAVRMNAGCHGSEVVDWLFSVDICDFEAGKLLVRTAEELDLSYRRSNLADHEVVWRASFRTVPSERALGEHTMRDITRWRRRHQPGGTHNAGSVFKNPGADAAGRIIDDLGLKGFRVGKVAVSQKHANFFVAEPGATAQEVYDLVGEVRRRVAEETGTWLTPEIRFVGEFRERGP